jgi:hypothetical protein
VGFVHLGRGRQRLYGLWLEAADDSPIFWRIRDVGPVVFRAGADNVAGKHRDYVRRLVAMPAGLLISQKKTGNRFAISGF